MAKVDFCGKTAALRSMMFEGDGEQARAEVILLLNDGYASRPFLRLVAEMLDPPKRGRGAPAHPPKRWIDIALQFEKLEDEGVSRIEAIADCCVVFGVSEGTAAKAVRLYREAKEAMAETE